MVNYLKYNVTWYILTQKLRGMFTSPSPDMIKKKHMPMYFVESGMYEWYTRWANKNQVYMGVGNPYKWPITTTYRGYNSIYNW